MKTHLHDDLRGAACREITNPDVPTTNDTTRITCKACRQICNDWHAAGYTRTWGAWERASNPGVRQ